MVFTGEHSDPRTYKVSFDRILAELKDYYNPQWSLSQGGKELVDFFDNIGFTEKQFRGRETIRLKQLKHLYQNDFLDSSFRVLSSIN